MGIQHILTTIQHINLHKAIHNYHARHYIWEVSKILIPASLTAVVTFIAVKITDNRNQKRWLNDGLIKRKTELEIEIRKILLNIKRQLDLLPSLEKLEEIKNNLSKDYINELEQINETFSEIKREIKAYARLGGMLIANGNLEDDYIIEPLIDEYLIFVKTKNVFSDYNKIYNEFLKTPSHETKTQKDELGNDKKIGVSQEDLENENFDKVKNLIETIYKFKEQTKTLIEIIEKNFKISTNK